ncbi:sensor domain-containing diguanylate cyclase [Solibacillus sp. CAU 1738]|uniref:sensor domain-containing diguanylate cyclase n=1 Tax=Solibacillus sp. CAU 1738 TaxID=3140363 RepID=UPI003260D70F
MKSIKIKLKYLIMGVVIIAFLTTMISNLWSAYRINTDALTYNTLETNEVYAQKLATTANNYIHDTFTTLQFTANYIAARMDDDEILMNEANRLRTQNNMFNSVAIADAEGTVIAVSPPSLEVKGVTLDSVGAQEAIEKKIPLISKPFEAVTGRLVIFISYPIFSSTGDYLGFVGGTIYIKEQNMFYSLLGQHYYDDGSYVFVVDGDGKIIYHKDASRLEDVVMDNPVVKAVTSGKQGSQSVVNSKGIDMLAGYSPISVANWGVIVQRPTEAALAPAGELVKRLASIAFPFVLVAFIIVLWLAVRIAKPLQQMATLTEQSMETRNVDELKDVSEWYFETYQLKSVLVTSLSMLHGQVSFFQKESTTDPLTGLTNRRTMDRYLKKWTEESNPYALLIIDLDHFKSINDTYGHSVGDEVLKYLAAKMKEYARAEDICCRYGGEEFIMLLPNTNAEQAFEIAEALRQDLMATISPCGRAVTMSGGIAEYPKNGSLPAQIIEEADQSLYKAKQAGRNQVQIASVYRK